VGYLSRDCAVRAEAGAEKVEGSGADGWRSRRRNGIANRVVGSAVGVGSLAAAALVRGSGPGWRVGCFAAAETAGLSTWASQRDHVKKFRCIAASP